MSDLTDQIDNIQTSVDDHEDRLSTAEGTVDDHENRISTVEGYVGDGSTVGQLSFPLTPDTSQLIRQCFPTGTAQFSAGSVTVQDANISANSVILFSSTSSASAYGRWCVPGSGSVTFYSGDVTDSSSLSYVVFNP